MTIQKIKIISNNICYGPEPSPEDEVEQHLTITAKRRVWFTGYNYGEGFGNYKIGRRQQFIIDKTIANEIMALFSQYCESDPIICLATDIGDWEMAVTDTEHNVHTFKGSLCGGVSVGDTDLADYIREYIPIDNVFVFDGNLIEDNE